MEEIRRKGGEPVYMKENTSSDMLLGIVAGAALGAAGTMLMTQNDRQMKRTAHKMAKGAEHAVMQLDKMVTNFVDDHR